MTTELTHPVHPDDQLLIEDPEAYRDLVSDKFKPYFPRIPGYNVDPIDIGAGLRLLKQFGYDEWETTMVIEYALQRWSRGEEEDAEKGAIDPSFHGVDYTTWRAVLAAAVSAGTAALEATQP